LAVIDGLLHQDLEFIGSQKYRNGHLWEVRKKRSSQPCRRCGLFCERRYGKVSVLVRERSPNDNPLWLKVHKHRYYCEACRKPFTELTPGTYFKRRSTQRFRKWIRHCCENFRCLKDVSLYQNSSQGFIYKVHYEQLEVKTRELKSKRWPTTLGIDEHFFTRRRGYPEYVTVFTDLNKRKLFEVGSTKVKKKLIEQIEHIPGRENVKIVCIDLSSGYRSLIKEFFPNARIVADKFHVVKLLMNELMKERKLIEDHHKKVLSRKRILSNGQKLDYWVRSEMNQALKKYPNLDELYRAKESLHTLYRSKGFLRAYQSYRRLITSLENCNHPKLQILRRTLKKWRDEILNYFDFQVTNGLTEAMNGNAKALQRRARGYKQFKNYRLALLNACAF
jgi:transposase